jgi:hypothetical protein
MIRILRTTLLCYDWASPMNIVIQNAKDLMYLDSSRQWTADSHQAMTFENFRVAVAYCSTHKLGDVQIVLKPEDESDGSFPNLAPPGHAPPGPAAVPLLALARLTCAPRPSALG